MNYALFRKPSRYVGNEVNIIRKEADIHVALCFPDTYEIGMSHIGLKILYSIINNIPDASAERVYAPWVDLESHLRQHSLPLTSLEFQRPLKDFDLVGFTLQYELSYTNILNMLDLGGIPLKSSEREENSPLVIAGGPCSVNPLPLMPFIDAFVIGDGEDVIKEIISDVRPCLPAGRDQESGIRDKKALLQKLSEIEGVYVPSIHDSKRDKIKRRFVENLDTAPYPDKPLIPYMQTVHDRVAIEVSRGCTRGCRFCQAGMIFRPSRERSIDKILSLAQNSLAASGYEEVSFTSLSTGDYSCLLSLIKGFNKMCPDTHTSISLPSLRVGSISSEILKEIKSVKKTGFTIAPEAGTERLRNVINKDITEDEYEETLNRLFSEGWLKVKLYFMIGLPTETMADIDGLIEMAVKALQRGRRLAGRCIDINVGISAFVPKPHTPFQWTGQDQMSELRKKQDYIKKAFRKRRINFKGQHVENSLLEAVFSRADRDCARLLETAWKLGCRFDGWTEHFDYNKWIAAAGQTDIDLHEYATRRFDIDEELPWDFIDTGVTKSFFRSEYKKAIEETITPDCRNSCTGCGLECQSMEDRAQSTEHRRQNTEDRAQKANFSREINVRTKIRIKYSKTDVMRYLSHRELMASFFRATRRARLPLCYSEGFNPHPKVSFGPALAVGIESISEYLDMEMPVLIDPEDVMERLNISLPLGLKVLKASPVPLNVKTLSEFIKRYKYEVMVDGVDEVTKLFMQQQECLVLRNNRTVDIRPMVESAEADGQTLNLVLVDAEGAKPRPYDILKELLKKSAEEIQAVSIKRTGLYGYNAVQWADPMIRK